MRLFRTEGTITWVTYFTCPDCVSHINLHYYALEALADDQDNMRTLEPYVQNIEELKPTDNLETAVKTIEDDDWGFVTPFFMGGVEDEDDSLNRLSCKEVFVQLKQRFEDAMAQAKADAQQLKLPID